MPLRGELEEPARLASEVPSIDAALPEAEKELSCTSLRAEKEPAHASLESADATGNGSSVVGTLDDAQRLFDEGIEDLRAGDYEQATELLSRALEIR